MAGKIRGRKAVESGQLASIAPLGGKIGGKIQGRKNVESGHLALIAPLGGKISGKIVGKIQGRKNVESGQLASIASLGGKIGGRKAVESGRLASLIMKNPSKGQLYFGEQLQANAYTSHWTDGRVTLSDGTWVIPDYSFFTEKLAVELDGVYYHTKIPTIIAANNTRDRKLNDAGWRVIHIPYTTMADLKRDAPAWIAFIEAELV